MRLRLGFCLVAALFAVGAPVAGTPPQQLPSRVPPPPRLAPYVPTPRELAARMLELAAVTSKDVVYDLGSGDGRIPIMAAKKYGAKAVGIEMDAALVEQSIDNAKQAGVQALVTFRCEDALTSDFSAATVVTLYLSREANLQLRHKLTQLRRGSRVVSHLFDMGDWAPIVSEDFRGPGGWVRRVYLWKTDGIIR
jgi:SAM-dependent methyltransferase